MQFSDPDTLSEESFVVSSTDSRRREEEEEEEGEEWSRAQDKPGIFLTQEVCHTIHFFFMYNTIS